MTVAQPAGSDAAYADARFVRPPPAGSVAWHPRTTLIWQADGKAYYEPRVDAMCRFRRSFVAPDTIASATLRITADARYQLFVNGRYVGRGPARSDPRRQLVDVIDVAPLLLPGRGNVLAVLVLHHGYGTGQSIARVPGLLAELRLRDRSGVESVVGSDAAWRCELATSYLAGAPRMSGCHGAIEVFDARSAPLGWETASFDDSGWHPPACRSLANGNTPYWTFAERDIPPLEEGCVEARTVRADGRLRELPEPLARLHVQVIEELAAWEPSPAAACDLPLTIAGCGRGEASVVTIDLGRIEAGHPQLSVSGPPGTVIDLAYGEELHQGRVLLDPVANRAISRFILADGEQRLETAFTWRACRYLQLIVRNQDGPVVLTRAALRTRRASLTVRGRFGCDDGRWEAIWSLSAHTLRLCMQDGFLDSSSREQQQWMGDGRWQAVMNACLTGDPRLHRALLAQIGSSQDATGLTRSRYPDGHENLAPIPSFCLAWVASFADYVLATGDGSLPRAWWPNIVQALRWFTAYLDDDGLLVDVPHWPFIDWGERPTGPMPDVGRGGILAVLNLQHVEALRAAAWLAGLLDDRQAQEVFAARAERAAHGVRATLWDDAAGAYADCRVAGKLSPCIGEPANALALLHLHEPDDARSRTVLDTVFAGASAQPGGRPVTAASPYFMTVVCRALVRAGATHRAVDLVRSRYGAMLDAGATATWEMWRLVEHGADGRPRIVSASHAWGGAPLVLAAEGILGVRPIAPGYRRFAVEPELCGLDRASGTVPTPHGDIVVSLERRAGDGQVMVTMTVPPGTIAVWRGAELTAGEHRLEQPCRASVPLAG